MYNDQRVLGLICARGGSKGVPGKNIRNFCGKPLIAWSIECAQNCPEIDDVVVSTDDQAIADVAAEFGAEVPFIRPDHLASDKAKQVDAIVHALQFLKNNGREYDAVVLLQPTCPLRVVTDITGAIQLFYETESDTVISVTEEEGVLLTALYELDDNHRAHLKFPVPSGGTVRQDFAPLYHRCGVVYILKTGYVLETGALYGAKVSAQIIPKERSFDIDNEFDWDLTEMLMKRQQDF